MTNPDRQSQFDTASSKLIAWSKEPDSAGWHMELYKTKFGGYFMRYGCENGKHFLKELSRQEAHEMYLILPTKLSIKF